MIGSIYLDYENRTMEEVIVAFLNGRIESGTMLPRQIREEA